MDVMLNDHKSPIISDFVHLMNYRNGDDLPPFEEHLKQIEKGHDPLDQYINHGDRLQKAIDDTDKVISAMHQVTN